MVQVKDNEGKSFLFASPDVAVAEHHSPECNAKSSPFASPFGSGSSNTKSSLFESSAPSFGCKNDPFSDSAPSLNVGSSSSLTSPVLFGNGRFAPATPFGKPQFPWSSNTSSCGDAKTGSCDCWRRLNNPSSGNNINSSTEIPPPLKGFSFGPPINGNSPSSLFVDKANTTTTRSCSCGGRLNNPPSENKISSTPLFGPASVPSHTTNFLASQETPNPFQPPPFAQFPWNGSFTAIPVNAAIPNNYCNGFTSLYGVPSWLADGRYPYGLPQHILLMVLSPVPTTPLFSTLNGSSSPAYATPSNDNQLKNCTCCCKCNKANNEPKSSPFAPPTGCGSGLSSSASPWPFLPSAGPFFGYKTDPFSGSAPPHNSGSSSPFGSPVISGSARFATDNAPSFEPKSSPFASPFGPSNNNATVAANPATSGSTNCTNREVMFGPVAEHHSSECNTKPSPFAPPFGSGSCSSSLGFARFATDNAPSFVAEHHSSECNTKPSPFAPLFGSGSCSSSLGFARFATDNAPSFEPVPNRGFTFTGNSRGEANPPSSGFFFTPEFKYAETDVEGYLGGAGGKLVSISAMPAAGNRSVEELRWNNYQSSGARDVSQN